MDVRSIVEQIGNWKIIDDDGNTLVKVISFPAGNSGFAGESMWVEVVDGNENSGSGYLRNTPAFCDIEYGALVRFDGGTDDIKPHFTGIVNIDNEEVGNV